MPFTFKLSQRLARMRSAVLSTSRAAVAACGVPQAKVTRSTQPQVARLVIPPANSTLEPSQTRRVFVLATVSGGSL